MKTYVTKWALLLVLATPLYAGVHYTAKTTSKAEGNNKDVVIDVEAWIDGQNAKVVYRDVENNPTVKPGAYVITNDGSKTLYLVDPENKTYTKWDIQAMMQFAGGMMNQMKGIMNFEFSDPQVTLLKEGSGPSMHGLSTRHYQYKTTYEMKMKVIGIKRLHQIESIQDFWTASSLKDPAFASWLRNQPPATGDESIDKILAAEMKKMKGYPLKTKTVQTTKQFNKKGKLKNTSVSHSEMIVTSFEQTSIPAKTFVIPKDYTETESPTDGSTKLRDIFKRK